jgi:hypothetical protein
MTIDHESLFDRIECQMVLQESTVHFWTMLERPINNCKSSLDYRWFPYMSRLIFRVDSLEKANQQLIINEQELNDLRQQLRQRDRDFEQNLQRLKSQSLNGGDSRSNLQENIDMIRLQRELRDKSDELRRLQSQSANAESVSQ